MAGRCRVCRAWGRLYRACTVRDSGPSHGTIHTSNSDTHSRLAGPVFHSKYPLHRLELSRNKSGDEAGRVDKGNRIIVYIAVAAALRTFVNFIFGEEPARHRIVVSTGTRRTA